MLSYVTIGADDVPRAGKFYSAFLPHLGFAVEEDKGCLIYSLPSAADGLGGPTQIYIMPPFDGRPASAGNGTMFAFQARTQREVRELHAAALAAGGRDEGAPGFRAEYSERFYVGYLRDPVGNKVALFSNNPAEPGRLG